VFITARTRIVVWSPALVGIVPFWQTAIMAYNYSTMAHCIWPWHCLWPNTKLS